MPFITDLEQRGGSDKNESDDLNQLQIGEGASTAIPSHIETIVNLVTERLQNQNQARPTISNWNYYERATPTSVEVQSVQQAPSNNYSVKIQKSDFNDVFDVKKALSKIPKNNRLDASKLLNEIENRPTELNFDSNGTIFIDGESIEGNFFIFFPSLYKKRIPKTPGFLDFLNKLSSMGLTHLFTLKPYVGRNSASIDGSLSKELSRTTTRTKSWWLLI